ncbi:hypothetical protein C471_05511 [Halorubrum saccharovorum DSM 1137]|uniref:Uncharacterized protein n=1 Tax=Halorubrum saccharovorum DSM 1137 TaxID=1227484 RepID=M0E1P4_9EURY|nr:hypothetical protein C471_05511 [Halorubrum saccharovorum DSM 1137]
MDVPSGTYRMISRTFATGPDGPPSFIPDGLWFPPSDPTVDSAMIVRARIRQRRLVPEYSF